MLERGGLLSFFFRTIHCKHLQMQQFQELDACRQEFLPVLHLFCRLACMLNTVRLSRLQEEIISEEYDELSGIN